MDNPLPVLVLQHPLEAAQAKGSLPLLRLSLARCRVEVGERFDDAALARWLQPEGGGHSLLLYPDVPAAPAQALHRPGAAGGQAPDATARPADGPGRIGQLVVLDATWRKSLKLLLTHPLLQGLPRLALGESADSGASRYRMLRRAPGALQRATLEATCLALAALEAGDSATGAGRYAALLAAFEQWVAQQASRARAGG